MDQIDKGNVTERSPVTKTLRQRRKEVPVEDDTESVIRVVRLIVVDVHAIPIEVANVDEVAVRARIAHSRP